MSIYNQSDFRINTSNTPRRNRQNPFCNKTCSPKVIKSKSRTRKNQIAEHQNNLKHLQRRIEDIGSVFHN